jgi:hypothetical protein
MAFERALLCANQAHRKLSEFLLFSLENVYCLLLFIRVGRPRGEETISMMVLRRCINLSNNLMLIFILPLYPLLIEYSIVKDAFVI